MEQRGTKSLLEKDVHHDCFQYYPICLPLDLRVAQDWHDCNLKTMLANVANGQSIISKTRKLEKH